MTRDLSEMHGPVTDLFAGSTPVKLTPEQIEHFRERGYLAGIRVLNDEQCDALLAELPGLMQGNELFHEFHSNESPDPAKVLFHALGHWRIAPAFHDLLWNRTIVSVAEQLLDGPVRFWHDQLFCKPAHHGGVVAWHQDYSYWTRTQPMAHLTCWIGLDDSRVDNGCLQYVPGSHKWPLLPITGLAGDMNAVQTVLNDEQKAQFRPVAIELKRGECSFHHPLLMHGSYENRTARQRRAAVLNFFRDGVASDSDEPLLTGVPVVPKGSKMGGQFFPLLTEA